MTVTDDRLSTIRGLLSKAEATSFPAEAEAFLAKATDLMSRYALDEAAVWASAEGGGGGAPTEIRLVMRRPYLGQKAILVNEVAKVFGCRAVRFPTEAKDTEHVVVVGFASDLEMVETLVTSLLLQSATAMAAAQPPGLDAAGSAGWRRSFLMGFIGQATDRLAEQHRRVADEVAAPTPGGSMALVLADRADDVAAEFRRRHPHIRVSRVSGGRSASGRAAGQSAGRRADLGHRRVGSQRAIASG
jgi:hypothetical protein